MTSLSAGTSERKLTSIFELQLLMLKTPIDVFTILWKYLKRVNLPPIPTFPPFSSPSSFLDIFFFVYRSGLRQPFAHSLRESHLHTGFPSDVASRKWLRHHVPIRRRFKRSRIRTKARKLVSKLSLDFSSVLHGMYFRFFWWFSLAGCGVDRGWNDNRPHYPVCCRQLFVLWLCKKEKGTREESSSTNQQ